MSIALLILWGLSVAMALYALAVGWQNHRSRRLGAAWRGWRYQNTFLKSMSQAAYVMAGTTPQGVVWELQRVRQNGRNLFIWSAAPAKLPYGTVQILPQQANTSFESDLPLRLMSWNNPDWAKMPFANILIRVSHQQLAERFLIEEVLLSLNYWPEWPLAGSLDGIFWNQNQLEIRVHYSGDWATADRTVALGTTLADHWRITTA